MKTTYRPRSNAGSRKRATLVLVVFVIAASVLFIVRKPIVSTISPLWRGANAFSTSIDTFLTLLHSKESLVRENQELKNTLLSQELTITTLRGVADAREELLQVYGRSASSSGIAASVLIHPPETPYDVLVVDAGSSEGVTEGDKVFLPEGVALGVVTSVTSHQAHVTMYSSSAQKTNAVLERNSVPIILLGQGGGNFRVDLPKNVEVVVGERVLAPEIESAPIGVVGDVETTPTDSAQHVRIRSLVHITSVRHVLIRPL